MPHRMREATTSVRRFGRKLDAPLTVARPCDGVAPAEAGALDLDDRVAGGRIRGQRGAADAPEQVAVAVPARPRVQPAVSPMAVREGWIESRHEVQAASATSVVAQTSARNGTVPAPEVQRGAAIGRRCGPEPDVIRLDDCARGRPTAQPWRSYRKSCDSRLGALARQPADPLRFDGGDAVLNLQRPLDEQVRLADDRLRAAR